MKSGRRVPEERLRALLASAHRAREEREVGRGWQGKLMTRIGEIGPLDARPRFPFALDSLVWKIAPFTLAMSVVLALFLAGLYVTTRYDGLQLTVRDAKELALRQVLGG
jgi:hypothetical protein